MGKQLVPEFHYQGTSVCSVCRGAVNVYRVDLGGIILITRWCDRCDRMPRTT